MNGLERNRVIIVQHQHESVSRSGQGVHEYGQDRLGRRLLRARAQQGRCLHTNVRPHRFQSGDQIGQELIKMIISIIERDPCEG